MTTKKKEELKLHEVTKEVKKILGDNVKVVNFHGIDIEVKQYLPIQDKIDLVGTAYVSGVDIGDDLETVDSCKVNILFKLLLVNAYTNIKFNNNLRNYDLLLESGLYEVVYDNIPKDELFGLHDMLFDVVEDGKREIEQRNSIPFIIKGFVNKIVDFFSDEKKLDKFIKKMDKAVAKAKKEIDNFEPDKLEFVKEFMAVNSGKSITESDKLSKGDK
jgi:hypothetical protein